MQVHFWEKICQCTVHLAQTKLQKSLEENGLGKYHPSKVFDLVDENFLQYHKIPKAWSYSTGIFLSKMPFYSCS